MVDNSNNLLIFNEYISLGWYLTPIKQGSKSPVVKDWNSKENTISNFFQLNPHQQGVGLCHAYSGTVSIDIDDMFRADLELSKQGINIYALMNAPDAVTIVSGKGGHGKLLYKMPLGMSLPSKKLIDVRADGIKYNYLDFRCGTTDGKTVQDLLPPSIHPETLQPYQWGGAGDFKNLPIIPNELLSFWLELLKQDTERPTTSNQPSDANVEDILEALDFINPDINRDAWVSIGMALHHFGAQNNNDDEMFNIFNNWSSKSSTKYQGVKDVSNVWRSFKPNGTITINTMFALAYEYGYKPTINPEEVFADVEIIQPVPDWLTIQAEPKPTEYRPVMNMLDALTLPPPHLDMGLFPKVLERRANEIAESIGADPLVPLFAGLSAISGAVDARTRLELVHGFQVPPVLWAMTIGNPADKKSPASRPMFRVLSELEREDRANYEKNYLEWQGKEASYAAAHKAFLEYHANPLDHLNADEAPLVPELPPQPVPLKITVSDITSQKLVRNAADRPRGLLCYLDEMQAWVRKMTDARSGEDRSAWVQAYESEPYEMDRVGAGSIYAENMAVSIYGNIQPRVFKDSLNSLSADGLLQRFIPVILRGEMTRLGNPIPEFLTNANEYDELVRRTFTLPAHTYKLSPEAYARFRAFQEWYEKTKWEERLIQSNDVFMTAFGKLEGLLGRIALLFHIIEDPYSHEVAGNVMARVIELVKGYIIPAFNYAYGEVGGLNDDSMEHFLAKKILTDASVKDSLTLRDLKRSARRRILDMPTHKAENALVEAMNALEGFGWVKLVDTNLNSNRYTWHINPQLAVVYAEQRDELIRINQERHQQMQESFAKRAAEKEKMAKLKET